MGKMRTSASYKLSSFKELEGKTITRMRAIDGYIYIHTKAKIYRVFYTHCDVHDFSLDVETMAGTDIKRVDSHVDIEEYKVYYMVVNVYNQKLKWFANLDSAEFRERVYRY